MMSTYIEETPQELNRGQEVAQRIAEVTHGFVSPAHPITLAGLAASTHAAPHLDTWGGIIEDGLGFGADVVDGRVARYFGVASELGGKLDATVDKIKVGINIFHIWRNRQAPRVLLSAVAAQNLANAAISLVDQLINEQPNVVSDTDGKLAMAEQTSGIGLHVVGNKVSETNSVLGFVVKLGGTAVSLHGLIKHGLPATRHYSQALKDGERKPWVKKLIGQQN